MKNKLFIQKFINAFPELDSEADLNGADCVDRVAELREEAKKLLTEQNNLKTALIHWAECFDNGTIDDEYHQEIQEVLLHAAEKL